jgi:integrase
MRRRGGGSVFRRGGAYWLKYYRDGRPVRESVAKSLGKPPDLVTDKEARALLNKRLGAIAGGQPIAIGADRVRVGALLDDLITEYIANGRKSLRRTRFSVAHLRRTFANARAQSLDTASIRQYMARRQSASVSNATINRELAALKRTLTLAMQGRKILIRPYIPMLRENNARQGFFERDQLDAVSRHLPEPVRPVALFGFITGWRVSEILGLTWRQVDFGASTVRLEPGTTKNGDGRTFPLHP